MLRSPLLVLHAERTTRGRRRPGELYRIKKFGCDDGVSCRRWEEGDEGDEDEEDWPPPPPPIVRTSEVRDVDEDDVLLVEDEGAAVQQVGRAEEWNNVLGYDEVDSATSATTTTTLTNGENDRDLLNVLDDDNESSADMKKIKRRTSLEVMRERGREKEVVIVEGAAARMKEEAEKRKKQEAEAARMKQEAENRKKEAEVEVARMKQEAEKRKKKVGRRKKKEEEEESWPKVKTYTEGSDVVTTIEFEPTIPAITKKNGDLKRGPPKGSSSRSSTSLGQGGEIVLLVPWVDYY